jgi:lysophospholipase L1-like esterase
MSRIQSPSRWTAIALGAVGVLLACTSDATVLGPRQVDPIFESYVAIGNSITAGFQSDGINDSTQQRSFAVLLARQMSTRFAYPALAGRGCRPPIANFQTQARVGTGSTAATCDLRVATSATDILNSVAVPGAGSADVDSATGPAGSFLTTLFLGGKTQIAKALDAQPTFATVWIGNNDVLQPAILGLPAGATTLTSFSSNYSKAINHLTSGAPGIKGVLIGVVQVGLAPVLFDARALLNPVFLGGLNQATGRTITIDPTTCTPTTTSLIGFPIVAQIRAGTHPAAIACSPVTAGPFAGLGQTLILDAGEQTQLTALVNSYNTYIKAKADSIGFGYFDPNPTLVSLRTSGAILTVPNIASATAPFGTGVSLDGIHPSSATHILVANGIIDIINAKYGTSIPKV